MRKQIIVLAAALLLAPLSAQGADLVVWWEEGVNPEEDAAVRETIAAFEQKTGKQVELEQPSQNDMEAKALAAVAAGQPPDFLFGSFTDTYFGQWAEEGRLVDLTDVIGPFASLFDPDALRFATLLDATTGRRALLTLPIAFSTHTVHVWRNLLEQAGFTLADIPKEWEAFWLDPSDPHRMPAAMQFLTRPRDQMLAVAAYDWRYLLPIYRELVWPQAVHRVGAEGVSPEQAVDEAIARIKQILAE